MILSTGKPKDKKGEEMTGYKIGYQENGKWQYMVALSKEDLLKIINEAVDHSRVTIKPIKLFSLEEDNE